MAFGLAIVCDVGAHAGHGLSSRAIEATITREHARVGHELAARTDLHSSPSVHAPAHCPGGDGDHCCRTDAWLSSPEPRWQAPFVIARVVVALDTTMPRVSAPARDAHVARHAISAPVGARAPPERC